jgi:thioredoxin-like negative regulator of GroEL
MADIDMQRLDWRQAIRVYEQIRTLRPDDEGARRQLIDLSLRLGQSAQAAAELESYMSYLQTSNNAVRMISFIEELLEERPEDMMLRRNLAQAYHLAGRNEEAVKELDALAESMLDTGRNDEAMVVINQILLMNPPNADQYRQLLRQLQG